MQFVADIDKKTGFDGLRVVEALTHREWKGARHLRKKYFFDLISIVDPYTWTFKDKKHSHLILYKGTTVIGYAHIQHWPESKAALRIIVIDESYRNYGFGSQFLKICERWLKYQGIKLLQIESSAAAYRFYSNRGYVEMAFNDVDGHKGSKKDIGMGKFLGC